MTISKKILTILKITSFLFLLLGMSNLSFAQQGQPWKLQMGGTVKDKTEGGDMQGVTVTVYQNGSPVQTIQTPKSGRFEVSLPGNGQYTVVFSKPGFVAKKLSVNTSGVPAEDSKYGFQFPMRMSLFQKVAGIDFSILNQPIGKINYNANTGYFDYDPDYTKSIKKQVDDLMKAYEAKMKALAAQKKQLEQAYQTAMNNGDDALKNDQLDKAQAAYQKAAGLKPNEQDPKDKLAQVEKLQQAQGALNKQYLAAVSSGDAAFKAKNYGDAKKYYNQALQLKPKEEYPQNQLDAIDNALNAQATTDKQYKSLIANADQYLKSNKLDLAKNNYQKASDLKPNEVYPKNQLQKISQMLAAGKQKDAQYQQLITDADQSFKSQSWQAAIADYNKALALKPDESYPKNQIALATKNLANKAELKKQYDAVIASADKLFGNKKYTSAESEYQKASQMMSSEQYPKDQIAKIETLLSANKQNDQNYDDLISQADQSFKNSKWQDAIDAYQKALKIKAGEKYPQDQIATAQKKLGLQQQNEAKYKQLIADADKAFQQKKYTDAAQGYNNALELMPNEQYPKDQIAKIQKALSSQQDAEQQYQSLIAQADNDFKSAKYKDAKDNYQKALTIQADEKYPKSQIVIIDAKLKAQAQKDSLAAQADAKQKQYYQALIEKADNAFKGQNYQAAKQSYQQALIVIPNQKYPQDQLAKIATLLAAANNKKDKQEAIDEKYKSLIAIADKAFTMKAYDDAVKKYQAAQAVKPKEQYPQNQIDAINGILAKAKAEKDKQKALDEKYNKIIATADKLFTDSSYKNAISNYQLALDIKRDEAYPKNKISEAKRLIAAAQKQKQEIIITVQAQQNEMNKYNAIIKKSDIYFAAKSYNLAKGGYQNALVLFPKKKYPKNQIGKIDSLIAFAARKKSKADSAKTIDKKYNGYIGLGNRAFNIAAYHNAKKNYKSALDIKPNEQYPKQRLDTIQTILAAQNKKTTQPNNQENVKKVTVTSNKEQKLDQKYDKLRQEYLKAKNHYFERIEKQHSQKIQQYADQQKTTRDKNYQDVIKITKQIADNNKEHIQKHKENVKQLQKKNGEWEKAMKKHTQDQLQQIADNNQKTQNLRDKIAARNKRGNQYHIDNYKDAQKEDEQIQQQEQQRLANNLAQRKKNIQHIEQQADQLAEMSKRGNQYHLNNYKDAQAENEKIARFYKSNTDRQNQAIADNYQKDVVEQQAKIAANHKRLNDKHQKDIKHLNAKTEAYENYMANVSKAGAQRSADNYKNFLAQQEKIKKRNEKGNKLHQDNYEALKKLQKQRDEKRSLIAKIFEKRRKNAYDAILAQENNINQKQKAMAKHQIDAGIAEVNYETSRRHRLFARLNKQEDQRHKMAMKEVEMQANQLAQISERGHQNYILNLKEMNDFDQQYKQYQRNLAQQQIEKINNQPPDKYMGNYATVVKSPLAAKYPVGVTELTQETPTKNGTILKRIVVHQDKSADVYEKIYYKWGAVYYKKDGHFTTLDIWDTQSK